MLVNVKIIGNSILGDSVSRKIPVSKGFYLSSHWNLEYEVGIDAYYPTHKDFLSPVLGKIEYEDEYIVLGSIPARGVCDSPEQFMETEVYKFISEAPVRKFFVSFVRIQKKDEPERGGWRAHKWGIYLGKQELTTEYIYDEPIIEELYTFHVYEVTNYPHVIDHV